VARHLDLLHRLGPGQRRLDVAVAALRTLPASDRDAALQGVLTAAIAAATAVAVATANHDGGSLRREEENAARPRMP
jgi:hypothetical protein